MANEVVVDRMVVKLSADVKELQQTIENMKKKYGQMEMGNGTKSIQAEKEKTKIAQKRIKDEVKSEGKSGKSFDGAFNASTLLFITPRMLQRVQELRRTLGTLRRS